MALKSSIDELIYLENIRPKYFKKSSESNPLPTSGFELLTIHIVIEYS